MAKKRGVGLHRNPHQMGNFQEDVFFSWRAFLKTLVIQVEFALHPIGRSNSVSHTVCGYSRNNFEECLRVTWEQRGVELQLRYSGQHWDVPWVKSHPDMNPWCSWALAVYVPACGEHWQGWTWSFCVLWVQQISLPDTPWSKGARTLSQSTPPENIHLWQQGPGDLRTCSPAHQLKKSQSIFPIRELLKWKQFGHE